MRFKSRLIILGISLGAAVMAVAACGGEPDRAQGEEATVTVQEIVNRVEVDTLLPETNELVFVDLQLGQSLQTGNLVKSHENSSARVDISIQNFTRVSRTGPKTIWRLGRYALNGEMVIELQAGKIFVFDEDNGQENWPLHIVTPAGTATARGTWMAVEFDPESGTVEVECLRGICEMENDLGYQVFTNEQSVVATAASVPTEPAPMEREQIQEFHELPEVLTEELAIPVPFTSAEAQAKLENARKEAVERYIPIDERKINFVPESQAGEESVKDVIDSEPAQDDPGAEPVQYVPGSDAITEEPAPAEATATKDSQGEDAQGEEPAPLEVSQVRDAQREEPAPAEDSQERDAQREEPAPVEDSQEKDAQREEPASIEDSQERDAQREEPAPDEAIATEEPALDEAIAIKEQAPDEAIATEEPAPDEAIATKDSQDDYHDDEEKALSVDLTGNVQHVRVERLDRSLPVMPMMRSR